jgi:hypothetical protein
MEGLTDSEVSSRFSFFPDVMPEMDISVEYFLQI